MSTFDWPETLVPQTAQLALRKAGVQFASPFNGTTQAVDFIAERWALSAALATISQRNPRGVRAFLNQLAGGVNRVRVWDFSGGGVPRGTLRGAPRVAVAAARGDATLTIKEATAHPNLFGGGSFEIDTDVNGRADAWNAYSLGSTGALTYTQHAVVPAHGSYHQRVEAAALGNTTGDHAGVYRNTPAAAGQTYAWTVSLRATAGSYTVKLYITWRDGAMAIINNITSTPSVLGAWGRFALSGTAPANAASADLFVLMQQGGGALCQLEIDAAQFEVAAASAPVSAFAGYATLRADDMIAAGGQLFQVASDCIANDAGTIVVPLVNRVRATIALDAACTWYRPTCEMMMPAMQSAPVVRPGAIDGAALDLLEVW